MKVEKRESVDCIHMDRDRDRRWAPVTTVVYMTKENRGTE
jgi:hypothetical protein